MDAGGTSKAKRLRHFWKVQPNQIVGRLLLALCEYCRGTESRHDQNLLSECRGVDGSAISISSHGGDPKTSFGLPAV